MGVGNFRLLFVGAFLVCGACTTTSSVNPSLLETETTAIPDSRVIPPVSDGSLTPITVPLASEYRGLLSGRRASRVGDTLTIILDELTQASKDGGTKASKNLSSDIGFGLSASAVNTAGGSLDGQVTGNTSFDGRGASTASNKFNGTITVTVVQVLSNGNLRVAGEKKIAVGGEEEIIRFGGVVSPVTISRNSVLSSHVADARIEYRGAGTTDLAKNPGWLTRLLLLAGLN